MPDAKITALTANTTPATTDILPMVDDPGGTPSTQKMTFANFLKVVNGLTEDTTPDTANDFLLSYDTSAGAAKKVKPSNIASTVPTDGWTAPTSETWTYASASTFTVSGDLTARFQKGTRLKLTQTTVKYFVVTGSSYSAPNTTVTVAVNTTHTLASAAITSPFYSYALDPAGYPDFFAFTPTWTNVTVGNGTVVARYSVDGRRVKGQVSLTLGTTSSISGQITVDCPITAVADFDYQAIGSAGMIDTGVSLYMGAAVMRTTSKIEVRAINAAGTYSVWTATSGTVPHTWGSTDQLTLEFEYYF